MVKYNVIINYSEDYIMKRLFTVLLAAMLLTLPMTACSKKNNGIKYVADNVEKADIEENSKVSGWVEDCEPNPINDVPNHLLVNREEVDGKVHHSVMVCRSEADKYGKVELVFDDSETDFYRIKIMIEESDKVCEYKDIYYLDFTTEKTEKLYIYDIYINGEDVHEVLQYTSEKFNFKK